MTKLENTEYRTSEYEFKEYGFNSHVEIENHENILPRKK